MSTKAGRPVRLSEPLLPANYRILYLIPGNTIRLTTVELPTYPRCPRRNAVWCTVDTRSISFRRIRDNRHPTNYLWLVFSRAGTHGLVF